jgi:predicted mannosyl-3-phosphoglycerate phosphatase (HAD superfamily)
MGWRDGTRYRGCMTVSTPHVVVFAAPDDVPPAIEQVRCPPSLAAGLAAERIILVFCSRRTRAEIEGLRQILGVFHPFICENGAAAFVPSRYFGSELLSARLVGGYEAIEFGLGYDRVVAAIRRTAQQYRIQVRGFADMSVEQVARECHLSLLEARLAKLREYSEPFQLLQGIPASQARLVRALASAGISCLPHGPFLQAVSVDGPGAALSVLTTLYRSAFGTVITASTGATLPAARGRLNLDDIDAALPAGGDVLSWIERIVTRVRASRHHAAPVAARMGA